MQSSLTEPRSTAPGPGAESFVYGRPVDADEGADRVTVRLDKRTHLTVGDVVHAEPNRGEVHLFDAASGERIEA